MAKVVAREAESVESLLKRFKSKVKKEEILEDCKKHEFFVSKSLARREKIINARRKSKQNKQKLK